jgi:hypothetical protein
MTATKRLAELSLQESTEHRGSKSTDAGQIHRTDRCNQARMELAFRAVAASRSDRRREPVTVVDPNRKRGQIPTDGAVRSGWTTDDGRRTTGDRSTIRDSLERVGRRPVRQTNVRGSPTTGQ